LLLNYKFDDECRLELKYDQSTLTNGRSINWLTAFLSRPNQQSKLLTGKIGVPTTIQSTYSQFKYTKSEQEKEQRVSYLWHSAQDISWERGAAWVCYMQNVVFDLFTGKIEVQKIELADAGERPGLALTSAQDLFLKNALAEVLDRSMTHLDSGNLEKVGNDLLGRLSAEMSTESTTETQKPKISASMIGFLSKDREITAGVTSPLEQHQQLFVISSRGEKIDDHRDLILVLTNFHVDEADLVRKICNQAKEMGISYNNLRLALVGQKNGAEHLFPHVHTFKNDINFRLFKVEPKSNRKILVRQIGSEYGFPIILKDEIVQENRNGNEPVQRAGAIYSLGYLQEKIRQINMGNLVASFYEQLELVTATVSDYVMGTGSVERAISTPILSLNIMRANIHDFGDPRAVDIFLTVLFVEVGPWLRFDDMADVVNLAHRCLAPMGHVSKIADDTLEIEIGTTKKGKKKRMKKFKIVTNDKQGRNAKESEINLFERAQEPAKSSTLLLHVEEGSVTRVFSCLLAE